MTLETILTNTFPERIDVHHYEDKIKGQELLLEKAIMRDDNKQAIRDFISFCKADPKVGGSRIRLYLYTLRNIGIWTGDKSFKDMDKKDIVNLVTRIKEHKFVSKKRLFYINLECKKNSVPEAEKNRFIQDVLEKEGAHYSLNSVDDYLKTIKKFWKWLYDTDGEDPQMTRWIRRGTFNKEPQIFSKEEIRRIISGCSNVRDKALFACMYDLGCRVSELLTRQIKHIKYDEDGDIQILVEADKTSKKHWETLFESVPYLVTWLKMHPNALDQNAPLWTNLSSKGDIEHLNYPNVRKTFIRICRNQGIRIGKKNNIHMIRKSKATHDIMDGVPLSIIESRGSWSKGSKSLHECYICVQDEDKKNIYKKKYGMPHTMKEKEKLELKRCDRCQAIVESGSKYCTKCGFCMDKALRETTKKANDQISGLVDNNALSDMIRKIVSEEMKK